MVADKAWIEERIQILRNDAKRAFAKQDFREAEKCDRLADQLAEWLRQKVAEEALRRQPVKTGRGA